MKGGKSNENVFKNTSFIHLDSDRPVYQNDHKYIFAIETDSNGVAHNIYKTCTITTRQRHWKYICSKCGETTYEYDDTIQVHSAKHS